MTDESGAGIGQKGEIFPQPFEMAKKSTEEGYVPVSSDELFDSLSNVCSILDSIGAPHLLSGGTLLGAVREGDLIEGDSDWDLDVLDTDVEKILANEALFLEKGLKFAYPQYADAAPFSGSGDALLGCERRILKVLDKDDRFHGDLFIYTLFTDGIIRRFNVENDTYFNPKMSFPIYFFENPCTLTVRDRAFHGPAEPELMVERIYGPKWRIPMKRHDTASGYNFAGAHTNADIDKSIRFAIEKGWVPYYPQAQKWPRPIRFMGKTTSIKWITRHEHPEVIPVEIANDLEAGVNERNARALLLYRAKISDLKAKAEKTKKLQGAIKQAHLQELAAAKTEIADLKAKATSVKKRLKNLVRRNEQITADAVEEIARVKREAGDYRKRMFEVRIAHTESRLLADAQIQRLEKELEESNVKILTLKIQHKDSLQVALDQVAALAVAKMKTDRAAKKHKNELSNAFMQNGRLNIDLKLANSKLLELESSRVVKILRWFNSKIGKTPG